MAAASRYGSTDEIASSIAASLTRSGIDATSYDVDLAPPPDGYDAVVLGSAVYAGRWLDGARHYVKHHGKTLAGMPVWLFSSGPVGDPPVPEEDPVDLVDLSTKTAARGHRLFGGKLDRRRLRFADRAVATALRAPDGDFRDWDSIAAWAKSIAEALGAEVETTRA